MRVYAHFRRVGWLLNPKPFNPGGGGERKTSKTWAKNQVQLLGFAGGPLPSVGVSGWDPSFLGTRSYEPLSKLLVSPLITPIVVPYIIPYISPFKEFRLWFICTSKSNTMYSLRLSTRRMPARHGMQIASHQTQLLP